MEPKIFSFKYIATVLLTLGTLMLGGLDARQKRRYTPPDDGASWIQGPAEIKARRSGGWTSDKAGIRGGYFKRDKRPDDTERPSGDASSLRGGLATATYSPEQRERNRR